MRLARRLAATSLAAVAACALAASCSGNPPAGSGPARPAARPPGYLSSLGSAWSQTFYAAFSGTRLDTSLWDTCYPWQSQEGCTNFGNANEYEWYLPSQDQVYGGALHLVPEQAPTQGRSSNWAGKKEYSYRSGMVTTYSSYSFQYGYLQVVARIPFGTGLWPALWLLPENEQWPPEIDIIEHYGTSPISYQHLHSALLPAQRASESMPDLSSGWHTFGLYWSQNQIIWFIDGQQVFESTTGIPEQPMYFIANLAVYQQGTEGWNPAADAMAIKSVTVWQGKSYARTSSPASPVSAK
jgi:beta-glucanase (GH16 family)